MSQRLKFNHDVDILPLLRGAEEDEDDDNVGTDGDGIDEEDGDEDGQDDDSNSDSSGTVSQKEYDKIKERMRLADKRASELDKKIKSYEDKDKSELQRLQDDLQAKEDLLAQRNAQVQSLLLENTFLTDNTYNWHNPKTAMRLLDRDEITIDDDGKVEGMAQALKKLADENSYLIKSTSDDSGTGGGGSTGEGANKRKQKKGPDTKALARKYPALQGRV